MRTICLIPGDGVGKEVIPAAAQVLQALKLDLTLVEAEAGFECFQRCGEALPEATLQMARQSDAVLFGATSSPSGGMKGYGSPILALRKELSLYANLRPVQSLPGEFSQPGIDLLIVRENSEGLYSGRERREGDTAIAERVITRAASERITRVACEQAIRRAQLRGAPPTLTVVHKANVLKVSDGLFRECALRVAQEYPQIAVREMLVDSAAMKLVKSPQSFDVIVTTNLFGDILSDEASALVGGLGVAPSANVGEGTPVFEPVHGSAPNIAGQGIANPVGAMLSAAMLLETLAACRSGRHIPMRQRGWHRDASLLSDRLLGMEQAAQTWRGAIHATLAAGILTPDLGGSATTDEFTRAVCEYVESHRVPPSPSRMLRNSPLESGNSKLG